MSVASTPDNTFVIPLTPDPQVFEITLGGIDYELTLKWNDQDQGGWAIDIADSNAVPIACNIPLVTGIDLLSGLEYLGINGSLYIYTMGSDPFAVPTFEDLGTDSNLYFISSVAGV